MDNPTRRRCLATALGSLSFGLLTMRTRLAWAGAITVPPAMQASLLVRVASYDRSMKARAGALLRVLVLTRAGDGQSEKVAAEFAGALKGVDRIASVPHEEVIKAYTGPGALASEIKTLKPAIVYLTAGFSSDAASIGSALAGLDVLSVCAEASAVAKGVALGFDLIDGHPKMLLNMPQAKAQNVVLSAAVLKLVQVVA